MDHQKSRGILRRESTVPPSSFCAISKPCEVEVVNTSGLLGKFSRIPFTSERAEITSPTDKACTHTAPLPIREEGRSGKSLFGRDELLFQNARRKSRGAARVQSA